MDDEAKHARYAHIPIPTYDEAVRPSSSQNLRGPREVSDDAQRQALLGGDGRGPAYRPPTAESPRGSEDSDLARPELTGADARRRVEELDYLDPHTPPSALRHRARIPSKFSHHLSKLGATLSSWRLPSFRSFYAPVPVVADAETPAAPAPACRRSWLPRRRPSIPTLPDRYRMSAPTAARLVGLMLIGVLIYVLFILDVFPNNARYMGMRFDPEQVRAYVQDHVDAARIEQYLSHITSYDHVAGTEGDLYLAEWMRERWREQGSLDDIALLSYFVYLDYPKSGGRSVELTQGTNRGWTARLEEDIVDPFKQQTLAWHGHSFSGSAQGHLVYANGGSREDFAWLKTHGVTLNGSIALMRYYGTQGDRALKIKAAEDEGCVGALIYSDPSDDGSVKGPVWPDGPWRPEDSLQRGGVSLMSWVVGDPLTPGYGSTRDAKRLSREESKGLVKIPSLPLAWRDAKVLLKNLQGRGKPVPKDWVGGDKDFARDWYTGHDGADAPVVRMRNDNDANDQQQIWNLHGLIEGLEQPEKKVIVGNHRDSWCFGAVDPGSGSAVMMEIVRIFGELRRLGWRPLRTIEFVSWDAEEYNLVGSTEYVEDNIDNLRDNAVAYLNVDVGVHGPDPVFRAAGSPLWERSLLHVLDRVSVPDGSKTLRQVWDESRSRLDGLGAGSDYVAFQDMAGTTSIDFGFQGAAHGFPYHSCYETLDWVKKFGDPDFAWHRTLAQLWALLILEVADRPLLPFDVRTYARAIGGAYVDGLQRYAEEQFQKLGRPGHVADTGFDTAPLHAAASHLHDVAEHFHRFEDAWTANVLGTGGLESTHFARRRLEYNHALTQFETHLLDLPLGPHDPDPHGVPGRPQFKHVLFGPQAWSAYDPAFFPAVRDALDRANFTAAQLQLDTVVRVLRRATDHLQDA